MRRDRFEKRLLRRWFARVIIGTTPHPGGSPCWEWTGAHNAAGYSRFSVGLVDFYAHRWGYERFRGPIPDDRELDHMRCDNTGCVNPWHVELSTGKANVLRGQGPPARNARKTHCKRGHPFDEANTYHTKSGGRMCRTCCRDRMRTRRAAS